MMPMTLASGQDNQVLYGNFSFFVQFVNKDKKAPPEALGEEVLGAFSEISGLEASIEHKVVRQAGVNYGARVLTGPVNFGTVILKRGVARSQTLWRWWSQFAGADDVADGRPIKANRRDVFIGLIAISRSKDEKAAPERKIGMGWRLTNAMPVKFRVGDLNAKGSDVAVEELHLVHEGLHVAGVAK